MSSPTRHAPGGNRLLAALPPAALAPLQPHLVPVELAVGQSLYTPGVPLMMLYFPTQAVASLLLPMPDGPALEVATIGCEGLVGLPVFLDAPASAFACIAQVPGPAWGLTTEAFRRTVTATHPLHALLHRYTQTLLFQVAQTLACNQRHALAARCCRWLLMTQDRVGAETFVLTQELLARMLGVRRQRASAVASSLQRAGWIRYRRGVLTIVERGGLEAHTCACYGLITAEYDRLLGGGHAMSEGTKRMPGASIIPTDTGCATRGREGE